MKRKGHSVQISCDLLQVSASGFYQWTQCRLSPQQQQDKEFKPMIGNVFYKTKRAYGSRRIHKELQGQGEVIGRNRVARIMGEMELRALSKKSLSP